MKEFRIGIAGMHIESGTFSPLVTGYGDFFASRGEGMLIRYPWIGDGRSWDEGVEWLPLAHFRAMPGGVVTRDAYVRMKEEILASITAAGQLDGFYLDVHGAMAVEGVDDAELDLLNAVRDLIGSDLPLSCSQDLHGNVSADFIAGVDAITAYRTAPHVDVLETRERAARMLVHMIRSGEHPVRAWVGVPVLLSGEMTSTEAEPGRTVWSGLDDFSEGDTDGIWDSSIWAGYPWADQPRAMASVVVTGADADQVRMRASALAQVYWNKRLEFQFMSPAMDVDAAMGAVTGFSKPVFLSDAGDNPTAGGAGDTTGVLRKLLDMSLETGSSAIFASVPDRGAVDECLDAGEGAEVTVSIGGKLDPIHSEALSITGVVSCVCRRDKRMGPEVVLWTGNVSVILSAARRPYHKREDYLGLGLDPLETDVTVVKIGYLEPELKEMAASHILLLSEGGVNPELGCIPYQYLQRPMFPFDENFTWLPEPCVFC